MTNNSIQKKPRHQSVTFKLNLLTVMIVSNLFACYSCFSAEQQDVQFNTDVLDVSDRANIDLNHFSRAGYIMPGDYHMTLRINRTQLPEADVTFLAPEGDPAGSVPCLTPDIMKTLGMKEHDLEGVKWWHEGQCADFASVPGMTATGDLAQSTLYISIPQAFMEFSSDTWDPPSRWDDGVSGLLLDYSINADHTSGNDESATTSVSGSGTAGANLGPWRFRADWQYQHQDDESYGDLGQALQWTRYYLYRALPSLQSTLTMGQDTMNSQIFDNFQFLGGNLASDDKMLPPNMRGYAPEVNGVATSNAHVTISQQGRVLYETQVPAGPFSIQELSDAVTGKLDVKVEEQDGSVRTWQVNTATIPYLSRPGSVRYSVSAGRPTDWNRSTKGPFFGSAEASIGITNGWSGYGGLMASDGYQALGVGIGRDLLALGAVSFDVTQSRATLPDGTQRSGRSYRVSYSKRFDDYDSQITFAGYRFSEKDYMSMSEYLDALDDSDSGNYNYGSDKEMYTITFNKQFRDLGMSLNLSYSHQTYWDRAPNENWNLSLSRYFDFWRWKNLSISLNGYRNQSDVTNDEGIYLSLSVPIGDNNTLSYNGAVGDNASQSMSWYHQADQNNSWQMSAGTSEGSQGMVSGYYTHDGDIAESTLSGSYQQGQYTSAGLGLTGGITMTPYGAAMHRITVPGGTRLMVDTGGVADVPVYGNGAPSHSNLFGKAVISDVNSYYRNTAQVDVNNLGDNAEAITSVVQDTLTEGAIGYRKFMVIAGQKLMVTIRKADGSAPPFGASVMKEGRQTGIVGDEGSTWLSGVEPDVTMDVSWGDGDRCHITFPNKLPAEGLGGPELLMPCH